MSGQSYDASEPLPGLALPPGCRVVLASRSPRRLELLRLCVPETLIDVRPPLDARELGFAGLNHREDIARRALQIAETKTDDVLRQLDADAEPGNRPRLVVSADTEVVVTRPDGSAWAVGQPPEDADWPATVRCWFRESYAGRAHDVVTGLCVQLCGGRRVVRHAWSRVWMTANVDRWLEAYLAQGEPRGKAGGYALQGLGSIFIERVEGSLSNIIGLPLEDLFDALAELGVLS